MDALELLGNIVNSSILANLPPTSTLGNDITVNNVPFLRLATMPILNDNSSVAYLEPLLDEVILINQVRQAFNGIAALAVYKHMLNIQNNSITGTITYEKNMIRVNLGTAAPMISLLLACSGAASLLIPLTMRSRNIVPRDPNSIGGIALLLHYSRDLSSMLANATLEQSRQFLKDETFASRESMSPYARFTIVRENLHSNDLAAKEMSSPRMVLAWKPTILESWARLLVVLFAMTLIAALEVIQRISDRPDGITLIPGGDAAHYGSTLIPALVMWSVGALYSSLHFNTTLLSPYHKLQKGDATVNQAIFTHNLGSLSLITLVSSIKHRHFAAAFTALATILGSFLTIIVSGLYSTPQHIVRSAIVVHQVDNFDVAWNGTAFEDDGAGEALSLIVWQNMSYPDWTYNDLAIPTITLDGIDPDLTSKMTVLTTTVPARRAVLDCDYTSPQNVTVSINSFGSSIYSYVQSSCPGSNEEMIPIRISTNQLMNITNFGGQLNLLSETKTGANVVGIYPNHPPQLNEAGCHSLVFFFWCFPTYHPR